jgi:hypothetical protein
VPYAENALKEASVLTGALSGSLLTFASVGGDNALLRPRTVLPTLFRSTALSTVQCARKVKGLGLYTASLSKPLAKKNEK